MKTKNATYSLPIDMLEWIDRIAEQYQISRSRVVGLCIANFAYPYESRKAEHHGDTERVDRAMVEGVYRMADLLGQPLRQIEGGGDSVEVNRLD